MSLIRPEANVQQQVGVSVETTLEQRILGELGNLNKSVTDIKHNQELMSVRLLGDIDGDTEHGRLPIIERTVSDHGERIEDLEENQTRWKAYMTAGVAIGSVFGSIVTLLVRAAIDMWHRG